MYNIKKNIDRLKRGEPTFFLEPNDDKVKEEDIFSIRKYGKFKYIGKVKQTKKNNYIVKIYKYL